MMLLKNLTKLDTPKHHSVICSPRYQQNDEIQLFSHQETHIAKSFPKTDLNRIVGVDESCEDKEDVITNTFFNLPSHRLCTWKASLEHAEYVIEIGFNMSQR